MRGQRAGACRNWIGNFIRLNKLTGTKNCKNIPYIKKYCIILNKCGAWLEDSEG